MQIRVRRRQLEDDGLQRIRTAKSNTVKSRAPTIARILAREGRPVDRKGIYNFLQRLKETGTSWFGKALKPCTCTRR